MPPFNHQIIGGLKNFTGKLRYFYEIQSFPFEHRNHRF